MVIRKCSFLSTFIVLCFVTLLYGQVQDGPQHDKVVVCYVATWAVYRPEGGRFGLDDLDPSLCTHLVYSFAGLDEASSSIKSLDPWQDLKENYGKGGFERVVGLKAQYPHLKVSIAIGGWNEGSTKYSAMVADPEKRKKFVASVLTFVQRYGFDGLDLDWEYPAKRGGKPEDKANFVALVKELTDEFRDRNLILTAAFGAGRDTIEVAYELSKLSRYLTFIHMMCYDYHGTWDGTVGANAPLEGHHPTDFLSVNYTINYMISQGASPHKLVLGLPLYGRTFVLEDPSVTEVIFGVTKVKSSGFAGPYTKENGFFGYNEICQEMSNTSSTWIKHWDERSNTPYLRSGAKLISYDDPRSIANKIELAIQYKLGGVMVWSIDTDDFLGHCTEDVTAYEDFEKRLDSVLKNPVLDDIIHDLGLPDGTKKLTPSEAKKNYYQIKGNDLYLHIPTSESKKYPLMRTINTAIGIAEQEIMIMDAIKARERENEVGVKDDTGGVESVRGSALGLFLISFVVIFRL